MSLLAKARTSSQAVFFGQQIHSPPSGVISEDQPAIEARRSAAIVANARTTSHGAAPAVGETGSAGAGPPTMVTVDVSLIPSFFGNGVPEYPADAAAGELVFTQRSSS